MKQPVSLKFFIHIISYTIVQRLRWQQTISSSNRIHFQNKDIMALSFTLIESVAQTASRQNKCEREVYKQCTNEHRSLSKMWNYRNTFLCLFQVFWTWPYLWLNTNKSTTNIIHIEIELASINHWVHIFLDK